MSFGLMIASNYSTHFFCWYLRFIKKNHKIFLVTAGSFFFKCSGITPFFFYRKVALEFLRTSTHLVKSILEVLLGPLRVRLDESKLEALVGLKMINMNFYPVCPDPDLTVGVGRHSDLGTLTLLL